MLTEYIDEMVKTIKINAHIEPKILRLTECSYEILKKELKNIMIYENNKKEPPRYKNLSIEICEGDNFGIIII